MHRPEPQPVNVESPAPRVVVGSILAAVSAPAVWVFFVRVLDPGTPTHEFVPTLIQLAIALAICVVGLIGVTARHRVAMDHAARTVTWTKSVFGWQWRMETWQRSAMEAVLVVPSGRSYSAFLVGAGGRRPLLVNTSHADDASSWARALDVPFRDGRPRPGLAATEPVPTIRLLLGLMGIAIGIPAIFWLRLGETSFRYSVGIAGFFILLVSVIRYTDRFHVLPKTPSHTPSRLDFLGVIWLLSIPFGPFFGWLATEQITAGNWLVMAGIRVFLSVMLPAVGVLGLLRFVRGPHVVAAGVILLVGTAFPISTALGSTLDVVRGPVRENAEVTQVREIVVHVGTAHAVAPALLVDLADGRTLRSVENVEVHRGPAQLLVLQGLDRILEARQ